MHICFPRVCLQVIYQKWKSVSLPIEVTLSYFADAQTERPKMLTSLHIDWEGDYISILVILRSQTHEIVKGLDKHWRNGLYF